MTERIDTKTVLADLKDDVEWMRDPIIPKRHWYAETIIHLWDALAQEITDREALEKLLEEGRAILSNESIVKIQGDLVGQVVFGSWSERVDAALAAKPPTPKPPAPEPQILTTGWPYDKE